MEEHECAMACRYAYHKRSSKEQQAVLPLRIREVSCSNLGPTNFLITAVGTAFLSQQVHAVSLSQNLPTFTFFYVLSNSSFRHPITQCYLIWKPRWQSLHCLDYRLYKPGIVVPFLAGARDSPFSNASRTALGPTQISLKWVRPRRISPESEKAGE